MALLMGEGEKRNLQHIRKHFGMGIAHQEAGHIAALHRSGAGTDTHGLNAILGNMGKQPAGKLRQAFGMMKNGIALPQPQLPLAYRQEL